MLLCRLLYGRYNNETRARYVSVRVRRVEGFTTYLPSYRGEGVRERPVSFSTTTRGLRQAQAFGR